ncbi:hypothetical protein L596_023202 [Steinernema carpocapsae]|uniref:SXP/RAL-2 family protein Ani s 5-like cation-binding domain-containing protein n=1 Tax=Steinernema carpocapsae TaxID=34508 RepID=A0A4U5MCZ9_STECR|nr:hypothetical protein L596_023202 [Steinernema carpocapsae]
MKVFLVCVSVLCVLAHPRPEDDDLADDFDTIIMGSAADELATGAGGADLVDEIRNNLPPMIAKALDQFSDKGKAVVAKIIAEAKSDESSDTAFDEDKFMTELMDASPSDFALIVQAADELNQDIENLSQAVKDVLHMAKNVWAPGHSITKEEFQEFAQAIQDLSEEDRTSYFTLFPSSAQFYKSDTFQRALDGTLEFDEIV